MSELLVRMWNLIVLFDQEDPIERERTNEGICECRGAGLISPLAKYKIAMTTTMLQILYLQSTISQHYGKWGGQTAQNIGQQGQVTLGNTNNMVSALLLYSVTETL